LGERLLPRAFLDAPAEERAPVADALPGAERFLPIVGTDAPALGGMHVQPLLVTLDPRDDLLGPPQDHERLGRHRAVVREAAVIFRSGRCEEVESLVHGVVRARWRRGPERGGRSRALEEPPARERAHDPSSMIDAAGGRFIPHLPRYPYCYCLTINCYIH